MTVAEMIETLRLFPPEMQVRGKYDGMVESVHLKTAWLGKDEHGEFFADWKVSDTAVPVVVI